MAIHGQALRHRLLLGVPQENARHRPLFLCKSENWANEVLVNPVARAGIAAQASCGRGDQQVLNRAPTGRVVLLVNDFLFIAHHRNDDENWGRKTLRPGEVESVFARLLTLFLRGPTYCRLSGSDQALAPLSGEYVEAPGMGQFVVGCPVCGVEQLLDPLPWNLGGKILLNRATGLDCGERIIERAL